MGGLAGWRGWKPRLREVVQGARLETTPTEMPNRTAHHGNHGGSSTAHGGLSPATSRASTSRMFEQTLKRIQAQVRNLAYIMTRHAFVEMENDRLTIFDVEHTLLTGKITERQKDLQSDEWKYVVEGQTLGSEIATVVTKFTFTGTLVIITVYVK